MASLAQWIWVWVRSGSCWWTGKPGVLQSLRYKESAMTEWLNWTDTQSAIRLRRKEIRKPAHFFPKATYYAMMLQSCFLFCVALILIGVGNGNLLQYSCLENSMDWGAWLATIHRLQIDWGTGHTHARICFTVLCYFLLYSKVNQPYIYIYLLFFGWYRWICLHSFFWYHYSTCVHTHRGPVVFIFRFSLTMIIMMSCWKLIVYQLHQLF